MQKRFVPLWIVILLVVSALTANGILYAVKTFPRPLPPLVISHSPKPSDTLHPTLNPTPTAIQTPQPTPISTIVPSAGPDGWNTYRSYAHNYEISYPQEFYLTESKVDEAYWAKITSYNPQSFDRPGIPSSEIGIRIIPYPGKGGSLTSWSQEIEYVKSATTTVAGETAIRGQTESLGIGMGLIALMRGVDGYHISYSPPQSQYVNTFEQILTTFKFTN